MSYTPLVPYSICLYLYLHLYSGGYIASLAKHAYASYLTPPTILNKNIII